MDFYTLAQTIGLPLALLVVAILAGRQGVWVWRRELDACNVQLDEMRRDYEARLVAQREAHLAREAELAAATERWQTLFFQLLGPIASLADVVARKTTGGPP
jgi:hypothetical protein